MNVRIGSRVITLPTPLGEGGEARVYRIGPDTLVKVYRLPTDPEFDDDAAGLTASRIRLIVAQSKLSLFPRGLPDNVAAPQELVRETQSNLIVGFTMPFVRGAKALIDLMDAKTRDSLTDREVIEVFRDLMRTTRELHERGIVIGDNNPTNVLVLNGKAYVIDADAMQFGPFRSKVFMLDYVDPNRCKPQGDVLELVELHNEASDWYAWTVMLFRCLFLIHPYGGTYRPADKTRRVAQGLRGLPDYRVSVYHPEVIYPKQARPLDEAPPALEAFFRRYFVEGLRPEPTDAFLDSLGFNPDGSFDRTAKPAGIPKAQVQQQTVQLRQITAPSGKMMDVVYEEGSLSVLHHKGNVLYRDDKAILSIAKKPGLECFFAGPQVAVMLGSQVAVVNPGWEKPVIIDLASPATSAKGTVVGTSHGVVYWDGSLKLLFGRTEPKIKVLDVDSEISPIGLWSQGDYLFILANRRGKLGVAVYHLSWDTTLFQNAHPFASPADVHDAHAYVNAQGSWLFMTAESSSTCDVFDHTGRLMNHFEADDQSDEWMRTPHGKLQSGHLLFSPSQKGVSRLRMASGKLDVAQYPCSRDLSSLRLVGAGESGLIAVDRAANRIFHLTVTD